MGKCKIIFWLIVCLIYSSCNKEDIEQKNRYKIVGETITFVGQQWNTLWKHDVADLVLYKMDPNGDKIIYERDKDYVVDGNRIKRTPNTIIEDFTKHKILCDKNGKFEWSPDPNRNPELTISYQVYADYYYTDTSVFIQPSTKMSNILREKIAQHKSLKIITIGTSISFGAHTFENFYHNNDSQTYHQLVSRVLSSYYELRCVSENYSTDGGGVNQIQDLSKVLVEKPDLVILELGMNDHLGMNPNVDYYKNSLEQAITKLKENQIDVVLVGFFQQIESWIQEYPDNTILYNRILSELAQKYGLFFADIYAGFEKIDKTKLYKDYMGDYMHHPTSFAHQLYYLEIMPFFIDRPIKIDELLEYIYS